MCCDTEPLSDRALLLHEIMGTGPTELPMTPPSLCSGFDERATSASPVPARANLGWPKPPLLNLSLRVRARTVTVITSIDYGAANFL